MPGIFAADPTTTPATGGIFANANKSSAPPQPAPPQNFNPSLEDLNPAAGGTNTTTPQAKVPAPPTVTPAQDVKAKVSVVGDIFNAPDNSPLGVIKNTVMGIPKAAADYASGIMHDDIGQAVGNENLDETPAGVAINTGLDMPAQAASLAGNIARGINRDTAGATYATITGQKDWTPGNSLSMAIFGSATVPNVYENGKNYMIQNGVNPKVAAIEGLPFGMMMAITDVYGGPGEDAIKAIANERDPAMIEKLLDEHYPTLSQQSPQLADQLKDVTDPKIVSQTVTEALKQTTAQNLRVPTREAELESVTNQARLNSTPSEFKANMTPSTYKSYLNSTQPLVGGTRAGDEMVLNRPDEFNERLNDINTNQNRANHQDISDFFHQVNGITPAEEKPDITYASEEEENQTASIEKAAAQHEALQNAKPEEDVKPTEDPTTMKDVGGDTSPEEMAESEHLADEARVRSIAEIKAMGNVPEKKMIDLPEGSWQSILKGYSRNIPGVSKFKITDYLRTPEYVLERLGLQKGAELLQAAKDSYKSTLATELDRIKNWKSEVDKDGNPDSARRIFKYLDGEAKDTKPEMTDTEYRVAQEIKQSLHAWADRLNLPQDSRVSNYITHLFADTDEHGETVFDDPEMKNLMSDQPAKSVYDPFLQKRINKPGYKQDVFAALDAYAKRGSRKEAFDPALEAIEKMSRNLDTATYTYVTNLTHRINMRPTTIDDSIDNFIKELPGVGNKLGDRPLNRMTTKIRSVFNRASVGLNVRSAIRILGQGANTYAKLGEKYTTLGYYDFIKNAATHNLQDLSDANVLKDSFIQDRNAGVYKSALQKIDPALYAMFDTADKVNRGSAFYGARRYALDKGLSLEQATLYAKRTVRETHFDFSSVNTPPAIGGDIGKTATQFLTYTIRQGEFLSDLALQKNYLGLLRWTAATALFATTIGKAIGYTWQDILPAFSLSTNPLIRTGGDIATGIGDAASDNLSGAGTEAMDIAGSFIPGYSQGKNTVEGVSDVAQGNVTNSEGQTVAKVPQTPGNYAKGALFGPSSLSLDQQNNLNDIYTLLDKQSKGSGATKAANDEYQKLKQIQQTQGSEAANTAYHQLEQTDPDQAKLVLQLVNDEKGGITADETAMKKLNVSNRAQYLAQQFNGMSDPSQKQALWEKYVTDKVITPSVSKALLPLLKGAKGQ